MIAICFNKLLIQSGERQLVVDQPFFGWLGYSFSIFLSFFFFFFLFLLSLRLRRNYRFDEVALTELPFFEWPGYLFYLSFRARRKYRIDGKALNELPFLEWSEDLFFPSNFLFERGESIESTKWQWTNCHFLGDRSPLFFGFFFFFFYFSAIEAKLSIHRPGSERSAIS